MSCVIVFVNLAIPLSSNAELKTITFTEKDAADMVVILENYNTQKEIVDSLTEKTQVQDDQIKACDKTVVDLNKVIDTQKDAYEKQIKEVTPNIFQKTFQSIGMWGLILGGLYIAVLL